MKLDRLGEINKNKEDVNMKIIRYGNATDIDISFEDGTILKNIRYAHFKSGSVRNPMLPVVFGVGYIGIGEHRSKYKEIHSKPYRLWESMMSRCYNEKFHETSPTYKNCEVDSEWHDYQNFARWFYKNKWSEECLILDKDILKKGNKIYSSKTCSLVDYTLNGLFISTKSYRGKYPVGVNKKGAKFIARCNIGKDYRKWIGSFDSPVDAFYAYKIFKEEYVVNLANEYKNTYNDFPIELYNALIKFEVSIDD